LVVHYPVWVDAQLDFKYASAQPSDCRLVAKLKKGGLPKATLDDNGSEL
jgi:hypothetical protein